MGLGCNGLLDGGARSAEPSRLWFTPLPWPYGWPGTPAVIDGSVVIGVIGGMAAFDAVSGQPRWTARIWTTGEATFAGNVAARSGRACIADLFGVGCVSVSSGQVLWAVPPDSATQDAESAIDDTALYYGTRIHTVVARNLSDGTVRWVADLAPGAQFDDRITGVAARGDTIYATTVHWLDKQGFGKVGDLVALDRANGRELWRYSPQSRASGFLGAPVLAGDLAIVSDVYNAVLRAVRVSSGAEVWQTEARPGSFVTAQRQPFLVGDTLFAGSMDTQVFALDVRTGSYRWRVSAQAGSIGDIAPCGRFLLVVPIAGGPLTVINRQGLRVSRPAVMADDNDLRSGIGVLGSRAYVASTSGLYALNCPT